MSLDPGMRDLLSAARRGLEPTDEERDRTRLALSRKLGAGVFLAATTTAGTAGGAVAAATLGKVVLVGALFVGGALGVRTLTRPAAAPAPVPTTPSPSPTPVPSVAVVAPAPTVVSVPAPVPSASASASAPSPSTNQKAAAVAPTSSADDLDGELALLRRARVALAAGKLDAALALLDEHAASYPNGTFAEERRGLGVVAQCKAGRVGAVGRARAFLADRPGSPMAARVVEACGLEKDTP